MPLKVTTYHGTGRGKINFGDYDVIVTSYGLWGFLKSLDKSSITDYHS